MAYNGAGTFNLYTPGNPVVTGTTISSTWANNTLNDIATGLSTVICSDGQSIVTANIPMANFRLTGLGAATALTDAIRASQVQNSSMTYLTSVAGTNTITGAAGITPSAYAAGQQFAFIPANTNTSTTTLNVSSLGAKNVYQAGAACVGGEIVANVPVVVEYDGTQFNIIGPSELRGTWTPVLTFATPGDLSVAYTTQLGKYTKIGNIVFVDFSVVTSTFTFTTASGNLEITGLPFNSGGTSLFYCGQVQYSGITKASYTQFSAYVSAGTQLIAFRASGSGQVLAQVTASDTTSGGPITLNGSIAYKVS